MKIHELIALLQANGWVKVRMTGSHRQFQHPIFAGTITVAGKRSVDVPLGTLNVILKQAGFKK
ncbi:type II toxin-antitoxin system HicA family toxin [Duganella sp. CF517]|uniref:type II toxin-antitoxin system HicA family toxin n=1 Tax=Duganella sp. CF517 TaxID=1881038 RepID=UPI000B7D5B4C|nr:type II toxin-antitoxin system HicA family toxin [Duganella sp. CF517]